MQCNRVVIEAQNHPGTNLIGARPAQDIQEIKEPDSIVYQAAEQICDEISCKQANYMMVMGRNPANPLKILKDTSTGENQLLQTVRKSVF